MKPRPNVLYRLQWKHGRDLTGFIVKMLHGKWVVFNELHDYTFNGFSLMPLDAIQDLVELDPLHVGSRWKKAKGAVAEEPNLRASTLKGVIGEITDNYRLVGIIHKKHGLDDLTVGLISEVDEDHLRYHNVGVNAEVDEESCRLDFREILVLHFGRSYEMGLLNVIDYDRKIKLLAKGK